MLISIFVSSLKIYTKDKLEKASLTSGDLCYLCEKERHTVEHLLLKGSHLTVFWNEFYSWWLQNTKESIIQPKQTPTGVEFGTAVSKVFLI